MKLPALICALLLCYAVPSTQAQSPAPQKVLRYAFKVAETGFDPAQITDAYSKAIAAGIFDAPLEYDFGARPFKLRPATLAEMPEISADFKTITMRVKPGIYFADDPAFKGARRELTAADYVYSVKRHYDPKFKSGNLYILENAKILGLSELRRELMKAKKPFDYDREVEGLKTLDRYTFQIKLGVPDPRFVYQFSDAGFLGAVAREVVEFYGDKIMEHPVGTNAYRLAEWRRSSRIVLDKNPNFREVRYAETAPPDASEQLKAEVAALQGRKLPLADRVVIDIIEEAQPRWLSFLRGEADVIEEVPIDFAGVAMPGGHSAHDLDRIAALLDEHEAAHLVILGDLIHTRESYTTALDQKFRQFRARHADVAMTLVRGNHDRHAGDPPAHWGLQMVAEPFELGPFTCLHEPLLAVPPARTEAQHHTIELAGHLHPSLRLTTARESVALPCFWQHHRGIVLPSFGSVTGSSPISIDIGKSAVVVAGQQLHHLGSRG